MDYNTKTLESYYFQEEEEILCGEEVSSILNQFVDDYPSAIDRFFTRYYYKKGDNEFYEILFHSNRICLICLAPGHPAFAKGISNINFNVGNSDRSNNKVSGKGKKGAMALQDDSLLAILTTNDNTQYKIPSCIRGKLIEVNSRLMNNLKLFETEGDGYIAVVLPKPEHCDEIKNKLLTKEQYEELVTNICKD